MLRAGQRRKFARVTSANSAISFSLPLTDAGNGIVSLVPDFALGSATPTYTSASAKWTKLSSGLWGIVSTGVARSNYLGRNTAVGAYGGYLHESAGIQLVTPTAAIRDMTDASWVKVGMTVAKTATGIDGAANAASTLTATAPNATILQTLVAAATSRTNSAFVRRKTGTGTVILKQGTATLDITALITSFTYTRVQLNDNELNVAYGFQINTTGDEIEADINQFEAMTATEFATSPMDSAGAARAADRLTYPSAGNLDFTKGAAIVQVSANWTSLSRQALTATSNGRMICTSGPSTNIRVFDGTTTLDKNGLTDMNGVVRKRGSSWGAAGQYVTGDGAVPTNAAFDGSMGSGAAIEVGGPVGVEWNGTILTVALYTQQPAAAQLQSLTA